MQRIGRRRGRNPLEQMHSQAPWELDETLRVLAANASAADGVASWPAESWDAVRRARVLRWCIPISHGGDGLEGVELLQGYEKLASACLTTCFILSQRDAACRRLRDGESENLRRRLLAPLAAG